MRKNRIYTDIIILIFCLGMLLPFVNDAQAVTTTGEIPVMEDMATSGTPINNPFEIKDNNPPTLYSPANGALTNNPRPNFDWSTVSGATRYNIQIDDNPAFTSPNFDAYVTNSAYTPSSNLGSRTWYWRVRTSHTILWIEWWGDFSNSRYFVLDAIPPSAPQLLFPPHNVITTDNTVPFDWYGVSGCNYYRLLVDETSSFSSPRIDYSTSSTAYTSNSLPDGPYYWTVKARDYAGNWGAWAPTRYFLVDTIPPGQPQLILPLSSSVISDSTPTFIWNPVSTAVGYHIQVTPTTNYADSVIDTWTSGTSYTANPLPEGHYYWHVSARDHAYNYGPWSTSYHFTLDTTPPGIPSLITPDDGVITSDNTVFLDWSTVSTATYYGVQVDDDPAFNSPIINTGTSSSHLTTQVLADDVYYWRVKAQDAAGNWGSYSASRSFTVDTTSPAISLPGVTPIIPDDDDNLIFHCTVTDLFGVSSVILHYRLDGGTWVDETMYWVSGDTYEYMLGVLSYGTFVEYYFTATDNAAPANSALDDNGGSYYSFTVISHDTTGPTIAGVKHEPIVPNEYNVITFYANVTDESGVNYVQLAFRVNSGDWNYLALSLDVDDRYTITIGSLEIGDFVEYYIIAEDNSPNYNGNIDDNGGLYYSFTVGTSDSTGPTIFDVLTNPNNPTEVDSITITCQATDINDIQTITLHYRLDGGVWVNVSMTLVTGQTYEANIGSYSYGAFIEYFISATDNHTLHNLAIEDNDGSYYSFAISSSDVTGPVIANVAHSPNPTEAVLVNITCTVTDLNGIQTVKLYYRINGGAWVNVTMTLISGDTYGVSVGPFAAGDVVAYFIEATDNSPNHNVVFDKNDGGMYSFIVTGITIETSFYYLLPILAILSLAVLIRKRK